MLCSDDVQELVGRCLQGDERAMLELVEQFQGIVFGLCFRMLGHRQDAEDVTQESFLRVFRSLHHWDSSRAFRPWLLAIAGNRCRSLLAVRKNRLATTDQTEQVADWRIDPRPEQNLQEEVHRAVGYLREEYRRAFLLFHEQQLSYAEIAEVLDCPLGTVKTWVHRARRELAAHLRERGVVEEIGREV